MPATLVGVACGVFLIVIDRSDDRGFFGSGISKMSRSGDPDLDTSSDEMSRSCCQESIDDGDGRIACQRLCW